MPTTTKKPTTKDEKPAPETKTFDEHQLEDAMAQALRRLTVEFTNMHFAPYLPTIVKLCLKYTKEALNG